MFATIWLALCVTTTSGNTVVSKYEHDFLTQDECTEQMKYQNYDMGSIKRNCECVKVEQLEDNTGDNK